MKRLSLNFNVVLELCQGLIIQRQQMALAGVDEGYLVRFVGASNVQRGM